MKAVPEKVRPSPPPDPPPERYKHHVSEIIYEDKHK